MAGLTLVGIGGCLLSPQLDLPREAKGKRAASFAISFVEPLSDLLRRYGPALIVILVLVAIYRLPDFVSGVMANPLYIDLGFTKSDIATVSKLYGGGSALRARSAAAQRWRGWGSCPRLSSAASPPRRRT